MSILAFESHLASAYAVHCAPHGAVSRLARQRCVSRQGIYRQAARVSAALDAPDGSAALAQCRRRIAELEQQLAERDRRLAQAVILDDVKQAEFACVGQALGVSLPQLHTLLGVLRPKPASVAKLGRWTAAAGRRAGALLEVLDAHTAPQVEQAVLDEIYVRRPVLMVVEPDSLCWVSGRAHDRLTGAAWAPELARLPNLQAVVRDGGSCLRRGVADENRRRAQTGQTELADCLDHYHVLREGSRVVSRRERAARAAFAAAERLSAALAQKRRQGAPPGGLPTKVKYAWVKAERAMDRWQGEATVWGQVVAALQPVTAAGALNTRAQAEVRLAELLPQLPQRDYATLKRALGRPETLRYLDELGRKLEALPVSAELRGAAVQQEALRRRPEALQGGSPAAAALRGVLLLCAVALTRAGTAGVQAVAAVRAVLRHSWRASSLVECVNAALRMQQARHRKMSQGLLDLKRLYWNAHTFRTGKRRQQSPYQRLGVPWPPGVPWWELLKWTPERLRAELSALKQAG